MCFHKKSIFSVSVQEKGAIQYAKVKVIKCESTCFLTFIPLKKNVSSRFFTLLAFTDEFKNFFQFSFETLGLK